MKTAGYAIALMGAMAGDSENLMIPLLLIAVGIMLILADKYGGTRR